ncbi:MULTISPECIES: hypothetical protein [unclassified Undibacterium]|uniref:hypothetical protein n=1 Tax=unclassified Undibacterium TaxID=2630295 RepID=UPI002AC8D7EC|nr:MULTISPECIES: hypothetical protein [unclassified Undibacterium]MEB0138824.1 hypothetical protein [Undibacterium sp. CCC2.1]MEB0170700.1 hypothetical protein [Undibacterium sp. CCC1.1]MEB0177041.1 hypothetical protein [Undibacterium sp. CCC3.4]MEB0216330.1 hypothetical protein [Undibacterium sp. 5I2]WPX42514.1 hypothetical protein RHM61_14095 [Undibacterium sp. CCC3.4]
MSEQELIARLADAVVERSKPSIPLSVDLWDIRLVAGFLKRSESVVRERIVCKSDFPVAIRLPTGKGERGHPLYKVKEVIQWADRYREK